MKGENSIMELYCLPIVNSSWTSTEEHLLQFVSVNREQNILNYHYSIDKKLSLYAALLARMELSRLTHIPNNLLSFIIKPFHKPLLRSNVNCHFNFSHTRNMILCAVATEGPIGVDVENTDSKIKIEDMDIVFHPIEWNYIQQASYNLRPLRFYKIWTQKEAYLKFLGTGFSKDPKSFNVLDCRLSSHIFSFRWNTYTFSAFMPVPFCEPKVNFVSESDVKNFFCDN